MIHAFLILCFILLLILMKKAREQDAINTAQKYESKVQKIITSACHSTMRGVFAGFITGGPPMALTSGLIFGVSSAIVTAYDTIT